MFRKLALKIRRRETPFYDFLYRMAKRSRTLRLPLPRFIGNFLYYERSIRLAAWRGFWRVFYYEPMFRSRCAHVGEHFWLIGGMPLIEGNLKITVGDHCMMFGMSTFSCTRIYDEPELIVGNWSNLGYRTSISVGQRVEIGNNVRIASGCFIADNDGHPYDYYKRRKAHTEPVTKEQIKPIKIEDDCWIGVDCIILKGVTLGQGTIVGAKSVITRSVPPFCIVAGSPARVVKELPIPDEMAPLRERRDRELGRIPAGKESNS